MILGTLVVQVNPGKHLWTLATVALHSSHCHTLHSFSGRHIHAPHTPNEPRRWVLSPASRTPCLMQHNSFDNCSPDSLGGSLDLEVGPSHIQLGSLEAGSFHTAPVRAPTSALDTMGVVWELYRKLTTCKLPFL